MVAGGAHQLADRRTVVLRLVGPGDVPAITRLYLDLSPESFYRRFYCGQPGPALPVERRGWADNQPVTAPRSAGNDIRCCPGPD